VTGSITSLRAAVGDPPRFALGKPHVHLEASAEPELVTLPPRARAQRACGPRACYSSNSSSIPAQRAASGLRGGPGPAQRQRGLELGSDGIRYGLQRFRCISLHSAALDTLSTTTIATTPSSPTAELSDYGTIVSGGE
jgi:hypothetical protein